MHLRIRLTLTALFLAIPVVAEADPAFVIRSTAGTGAAAIQGAVDQFRSDLGDPNNGNAAGSQGSGRREINWDGGGSLATSPAGTPFTGFQARGAVFTTAGTGFTQAPLDGLATTFGNPSYQTGFSAFSPARLFTAVGSNILDVNFFIPGTSIPALVSGFGAVFSDVDLPGLTTLEFFDLNNQSLGLFDAPAFTGEATFSFLGVNFDSAVVSRVRVTNGNAALGAGVFENLNPNAGPVRDLVVMDDFIYAEPQPVPEPATLFLLGTGLAGVAGAARRKYRTRKGPQGV